MSKQREKLQEEYSQNMAKWWKEVPTYLLLPLWLWWEELSGGNKGKGPLFTKTQMWQYVAVDFLALLMTPVALIGTVVVMPLTLMVTAIIDTVIFAFDYLNAKDENTGTASMEHDPQAESYHDVVQNTSKGPTHSAFTEDFIHKYSLVDTSDQSLAKALRMAANSNEVRDIKYLLSVKSYLINWQGLETGKTALHLAVAKGHKEAIEALDELGAARDVADNEGVTVAAMLLSQRSGGHLSPTFIDRYSLQKISDESLAKAFRMAANSNEHEDLRVLFHMKPELIDAQDSNPKKGKTALHLAVEKGHQESIAVLKEFGAKTDIRDREYKKTVDELLQEQVEATEVPGLQVS